MSRGRLTGQMVIERAACPDRSPTPVRLRPRSLLGVRAWGVLVATLPGVPRRGSARYLKREHSVSCSEKGSLRALEDRVDRKRCISQETQTTGQQLSTYGRGGGQGRGRTADLPIFSRTLVPTELPGRVCGSDDLTLRKTDGRIAPAWHHYIGVVSSGTRRLWGGWLPPFTGRQGRRPSMRRRSGRWPGVVAHHGRPP